MTKGNIYGHKNQNEILRKTFQGDVILDWFEFTVYFPDHYDHYNFYEPSTWAASANNQIL